ncbi:hypothetical protein GWG65_29735 [Bradyrhizobium sp. CSA207]|uniref:hypothetical protein n=1 Tax=Bradyrhizobium sp. CSA207 TaxID=2698826 RepID=UPI0023B0C483|nr:hypothetical protein [Bradyrhizobium sp. CSA207]MDE5445534.1 hypothetical protein [Bradyrhizobium sp. CSA207]
MKVPQASLISILVLISVNASAAPSSSCAGKFVGVWKHYGIGSTNDATLTADGTAKCDGHPNCLQGTWTCAGNVLTYDNTIYKTDYTLQPDGTMTARGGITVVRAGRTRKLDLGNAGMVSAKLYGVDTTVPINTPSSQKPEVRQANRPVEPNEQDSQAASAARNLFEAGKAEFVVQNWSGATNRFEEAASQYRKAGDPKNERIALGNAQLAKAKAVRSQQDTSSQRRAGMHYSKYSLKCQQVLKQIAVLEADGADMVNQRQGLRAQGCE